MITKIVSGAQTGADRAGLDVAIRHAFPHGGWCPKGRKAEDGVIGGGQYQLVETPSASYLQRTEWNARDSDVTVVFTLAKNVTGGSLRTIEFAKKHKKPCVHISCAEYQPAEALIRFVEEHAIKVLNVAGSRESKEPGIWKWTYSVIEDSFFWSDNNPPMLGGPAEG